MAVATQAEEGRTKPEMPFQQTPNDLLMACMTRGSVTQRACLAAMLAANYGATKHLADIDRKAISRATGATPQAVRTALSRLVRENVVIRSEDGYRVNPRYWQWEEADPEQAKEFRRLGRSRKACPPRHKACPPRHDEASEAFPHRHGACPPRHETCLPRHEACPPRHETCLPRHETCLPRHAPLKREEIYIPPSGGEILEPPPPGTDSQSTGGDPGPAPMLNGIPVEERRAVAAEADRMSAGAWHLGLVGTALDSGIKPDVLREAMARAKLRGNMRWSYVLGIARDFAANGIDKPKPKPGSKEARDELLARIQANCKAYEERERAERLAARGAVA